MKLSPIIAKLAEEAESAFSTDMKLKFADVGELKMSLTDRLDSRVVGLHQAIKARHGVLGAAAAVTSVLAQVAHVGDELGGHAQPGLFDANTGEPKPEPEGAGVGTKEAFEADVDKAFGTVGPKPSPRARGSAKVTLEPPDVGEDEEEEEDDATA